MNNFTLTGSIKSAFKKEYFIPAILFLIAAGIVSVLISETANFLESFDISSFKAIMIAGLIEFGAIAILEYLILTKKSGYPLPEWFMRNIMILLLIAIFCFIIAATGLNSAKPMLQATGYKESDLIKLKAYEESIKALQDAVESVKGQQKNSAMASRELQKATAEKQAFLRELKPDTKLVFANNTGAAIAIGIRIILQSLSWLLSGILAGIFRKKAEKLDQFKAEIKKPELSKIEYVVIDHELDQSKENGNGKNGKNPKTIVTEFYPEAEAIKTETGFLIKSGTLELGKAGNASMAWASAYKQIREKENA